MALSGQLFIGEEGVSTAESFRALNPTLDQYLEPAFSAAGAAEVAVACALAASAFDRFRNLDATLRAQCYAKPCMAPLLFFIGIFDQPALVCRRPYLLRRT